MGEEVSLSKEPIAEWEAVHHVDSAFGFASAIVVFLANVLTSLVRFDTSERVDMLVAGLAFLAVTPLIPGLIGMLRQSWYWRIPAWFMVLWLLLCQVSLLGLGFAWRWFGLCVNILRPLIPYILFMHTILAFVLLWYVVRVAYLGRLCRIVGPTRYKELKDEIERYCMFSTPVPVIGLILLLLSNSR